MLNKKINLVYILIILIILLLIVVLLQCSSQENIKQEIKNTQEIINNFQDEELTKNQKINIKEENKNYNWKKAYTTPFWIGEDASEDNHWISNHHTAWDEAAVEHFGGVDTRYERNGHYPVGFTPLENPFYFALPFSDYDREGRKSNLSFIPWYEKLDKEKSLIKNKWIVVRYKNKTVYGQWEDCGPFTCDDVDYVFGDSEPINTILNKGSGLDLSPAMWHYLELPDNDYTEWTFIDEAEVPEGPWKEIITTRDPYWE